MEALGQVCSVPNIRVSELFFECIGRALRISVMLLSNLEHLKTLLVLRFFKKKLLVPRRFASNPLGINYVQCPYIAS